MALTDPIDIAPDPIVTQTWNEAILGQTAPVSPGSQPSTGTPVQATPAIVAVASDYRSPNFVPGLSGWELGSNGVIRAIGVILSGDISAITGHIGGFVIGATTVTGSNLVLDSTGQRISLGSANDIIILDADDATYRIWAGNATAASAPFSVTKAGVLNATGVTISGALTATTGSIGGFTLGSDYLKDTADSFGMSSTVTGGNDVRLWAGATFANRATAPFRVYEDGSIGGTSLAVTILDIGGADATSMHVDTNGNMWLGAATYDITTNPFAVSNAGVLRAVSGTIAGWTLSTTAFSTGAFDTLNKMYFGTSGLSLSNTFKVDNAGALTATGATISGAITATSGSFTGSVTATGGTIGGWNINSTSISKSVIVLDSANDKITVGGTNVILDTSGITAIAGNIGGFTLASGSLYGGIIKTAATVGMGNNGVIMDTDGIRGYSVGLGNTFNIPTDGSAPTFSSGIINYTTFNVDVDGIIQTSETVGDGSASSAGILINNTGFYATEANQTLANANVKILVNGTAYFNASIRGGQTDYNTGTGYFLGLSGGDYKFSIGSPAGNYMTWDGTYLKMKGSFDVGNTGLINNAVYTNATLPVPPTVTAFLVASAYE